jgi:sugar transferase EpsL
MTDGATGRQLSGSAGGVGAPAGAAASDIGRPRSAATGGARVQRRPPRWKRAMDVAGASLLLASLSPVIIAVAAAVRLTLGAPVLFRQVRPGLHGRPFTILKFRTMRPGGSGTDEREQGDADRLTRFGSVLRSTSLDELPELWNVVRGDMSLVGPRPLLMEYLEFYDDEQQRRHDVLPGLTGWAQVNGRNAQSWSERFARDVWYVDHMSFLLDVRILARTVVQVISRRDVAQPGHATRAPFRGRLD